MKNKASEKSSQPGNCAMMRTITLEEHYASPALLNSLGQRLRELAKITELFGSGKLIEELSDLDDKRIIAAQHD